MDMIEKIPLPSFLSKHTIPSFTYYEDAGMPPIYFPEGVCNPNQLVLDQKEFDDNLKKIKMNPIEHKPFDLAKYIKD